MSSSECVSSSGSSVRCSTQSERDARLRVIRFVCGKSVLMAYLQKWHAYRLERQAAAHHDVTLTPYQEACLDPTSRARFVEQTRREQLDRKVRAVRDQIAVAEKEAARQARLERNIAQCGDLVRQNQQAVAPTPPRSRAVSTVHAPCESNAPRQQDQPDSFSDAFQRLSVKQQREVLSTLIELNAVPPSLTRTTTTPTALPPPSPPH